MPLRLTRRRRLAGAAAALSASAASLSTIAITNHHSTLNDGARGLLVGLSLGLALALLVLVRRQCAR